MSELTHFRHAVRLLTIVPLPSEKSFEPDWLPRAAKYFPLAGLLIGALLAAVLLAASQVWSGLVPALLAVTTGVLLTGAFHEDGLADSADSLGGQTPERRLAIMQDSRIGSYGTLALIASVGLRVAALAAMPPWLAAAALIAAHAGGRCAGVMLINTLPYVAERVGKIVQSDDPLRGGEVVVACAFALLGFAPLLALAWPAGVTAALAGVVVAVLVARLATRLLGGYTGDVAGAIEQLFEVAVLLAVAAWGR
jgi:adenosylcobinamide-GDP ribazoletransferase